MPPCLRHPTHRTSADADNSNFRLVGLSNLSPCFNNDVDCCRVVDCQDNTIPIPFPYLLLDRPTCRHRFFSNDTNRVVLAYVYLTKNRVPISDHHQAGQNHHDRFGQASIFFMLSSDTYIPASCVRLSFFYSIHFYMFLENNIARSDQPCSSAGLCRSTVTRQS